MKIISITHAGDAQTFDELAYCVESDYIDARYALSQLRSGQGSYDATSRAIDALERIMERCDRLRA